jgi:UDP-N-acetylglucosamine--N-acetylmuramyl-(pentapeptide) pyrophosphoryl-undecaprenol N-acetylglucosamine transferase
MALVNKDAAILVKDSEASASLMKEAIDLVSNNSKQVTLRNNINKMAFHNSANVIAREVLKLANYSV